VLLPAVGNKDATPKVNKRHPHLHRACFLQGMISLDQQEKLKELADSMMVTA
jgi:hypothetical protein